MIESPRNERVVKAGRLHRAKYRRATGKTLLEGPHVIAAAQAAGFELELLFALEEDDSTRAATAAGVTVARVTEPVMRKLAPTEHPRGPVAVAAIPTAGTLEPVDTVVLCGVRDPGNAGTLIRSAAAFTFQVAATADTVDVWSPKVLRAAAGAHFVVNLVAGITVDDVISAGVMPVALLAHADGTEEPGPEVRPIGLLVGNEAHGLGEDLVAKAVATLTVPTSGAVESLNAAVAGSIAMFAIAAGR